MNLAEHPRQAQRRHGVVRQRVVVNHVRPRRGRPGELRQVEALLVLERRWRSRRSAARPRWRRRPASANASTAIRWNSSSGFCLPSARRWMLSRMSDEVGLVIGPAAVEVVEHDLPADRLQLLLADLLEPAPRSAPATAPPAPRGRSRCAAACFDARPGWRAAGRSAGCSARCWRARRAACPRRRAGRGRAGAPPCR